MEKIPWYQSAIIRQQIVMVIAGALGLLNISTDIDIDATVAIIFAAVTALVPLWTIFTRATKSAPPITDTAAKKDVEIQTVLKATGDTGIHKRQIGHARVTLMATLAMFGSLVIAAQLSGCVGTKAAYKAAEGVEQQAYVALEHYDALLKEGVKLKENPNVPREVVTSIQSADAKLFPVIQRVKAARDLYVAARTAPNEAELQRVVNDAVLLLADLIDAIKKARGAP